MVSHLLFGWCSVRNRLINCDCIPFMRSLPDQCVDFILTDIPYNGVNRDGNGLRNLDKGKADIATFTFDDFLPLVYRIIRSSLVIFCAADQLSEIFCFFKARQGTVRTLVWEKTNPMPMNAKAIYLSGIEHAVWFKKRGGVFNAFCKNTVFRHPQGSSKMHPTEKNHALLKELIEDNTTPGDLVFDPCAGSGSTLLVAKQLGRRYFGCELDRIFWEKANERLNGGNNV